MPAQPLPRVLVVEDELFVRLELTEAIEATGRDVFHVPSAEEALEALQQDASIGLVLTDIKMPGSMDGIELAKNIQQRWPSVRVVISSANIATDARCRSLGTPLLHKPYRLSDLRKVLDA